MRHGGRWRGRQRAPLGSYAIKTPSHHLLKQQKDGSTEEDPSTKTTPNQTEEKKTGKSKEDAKKATEITNFLVYCSCSGWRAIKAIKSILWSCVELH